MPMSTMPPMISALWPKRPPMVLPPQMPVTTEAVVTSITEMKRGRNSRQACPAMDWATPTAITEGSTIYTLGGIRTTATQSSTIYIINGKKILK